MVSGPSIKSQLPDIQTAAIFSILGLGLGAAAVFTVANSMIAAIKRQFEKEVLVLKEELASQKSELEARSREAEQIKRKYSKELEFDQDKEKASEDLRKLKAEVLDKRSSWEREYSSMLEELAALKKQVIHFGEIVELESYGVYEPVFNFDDPEKFKAEIKKNSERQKAKIKDKMAAACSQQWTVDGDAKKGKKMTDRNIQILLRAFNGECDSVIAKVRHDNITKQIEKIQKCYQSLNKLMQENHTYITREFLDLRLEELTLCYEHQRKKEQIKEEQRAIREQMQEECKVR